MKNCLGVISLVAELLDDHASRIDHDRLERLRRATSRLRTLLEADLSDSSELQQGTRIVRDTCSVEAIVRGVVDHVADRAEHACVKLVTHTAGGVVEGDHAALAECLINLVVNAIDASPPGGVVSLETQEIECGDQFWTVRDEGRGMTAVQLQRLGHSSSSTTRGGWGIGLAVTQQTIAHHGGALHVESRERGGTTFTIYLPRRQPPF